MSLFGVCYTHIIQICSAGSLEQAEWVIHFLSSSVEIIIREFCMGVCQDGSDIRLYLWEFSTFRSVRIFCAHVHGISDRGFE